MKWRIGTLLIALLGGALAACQHAPTTDVHSPGFVVPVGSRVVLEQPVRIPPRAARVYIQGERTGGYGAMNRFEPFCDLEFRDLAPEGRTIQPAIFTVTRVKRRWSDSDLTARPRQVAALGWMRDLPPITMVTEMWLDSPDYPRVMRLSCRETFFDLMDREHLSIHDIRQTVAPHMRLELPGSATPAQDLH